MLFTGTYFHKQPGNRFGLVMLFAIAVVYITLILQVQHNYLPVWSDEFFYYANASSYFENNTLRAALTFSGSGSSFLGADAHGFAYPLLNGGIAKVFGWHSLNFLYTNCFFVLISLAIVVLQKNSNVNDKIWTAVFILSFPLFSLYGFTFMQESIHVFFAVSCSFLLFNIYKTGKARYYTLFILLVVLASLFRPIWFFWLIGLIPSAKSKAQYYRFTIIFLMGVIVSFLVSQYFAEAVPNYFSSLQHLLSVGDIKAVLYSLVKHFVVNVYFYFSATENIFIYLPIKYFIFLVLVFFVVKAIKHKKRLYISIALIGVLNFILLFLFYDVFKWREIRVLAPFFYFCIPYLITASTPYFKYIQLLVLSILFIMALPLSKQWIQQRNMHTDEEIASTKQAFSTIAEKIDANKVVLINYTPADSTLDLTSLPVKSNSGNPIRYIVPYYNNLKRVPYNYMVSPSGTKVTGVVLISNKYYQLETVK